VRLRPASLYAIEQDVVLVPLTLLGLEREVVALGLRWRLKNEFHVTALSARRVADLVGSEPESVWGVVEPALRDHEVDEVVLRTRELRMVEEEDNRTLVAMADVNGLSALYDDLSRRLQIQIPPPPAHVTLYTNPGGEGIGLHDETDLRELTRELSEPEVDEVRRASGLDRLS
jgi:hypothetical protein